MIPTGKGIFIWQISKCGEADPQRIADLATAAGFDWVCLKAADGTYNYNQGLPTWTGPDLLGRTIERLRLAGIRVAGWQYVYGASYLGVSAARSEAKRAIENINRFEFDAWLIDAERQYKRQGASAWAADYMAALRTACPSVSLGLCSYRFPSVHPEIPWAAFLEKCDFHAPQVYWINAHNPAAQLQKSVAQLKALKPLPVVPVGAAYYDPGYKWQPLVSELDEFDQAAHDLGLPGLSWWEWGENGRGAEYLPDLWTALSAHTWRTSTPAQDWAAALTTWARSLGYNGPEPA